MGLSEYIRHPSVDVVVPVWGRDVAYAASRACFTEQLGAAYEPQNFGSE